MIERAPLAAIAPAKVNLFLHVGPPGADGFHPLVSLVAFSGTDMDEGLGDLVVVQVADRLSFQVGGAYAGEAGPNAENLVVRALELLGKRTAAGEPPLKVYLEKRLPVAAGLAGGSSDAGVVLTLARQALELDLDAGALEQIAAELGADGPLCLWAQAAWAQGRGDQLTFEPRLPPLPAVLVNPRVPAPTRAVYRAYDAEVTGIADWPAPPIDWSLPAVIEWLARQRNDLEAPAIALQPAIGEALAAVRRVPEVRLARMSGSGATVFGLCLDRTDAKAAAVALAASHPQWWVRSTVLNPGR